MNEENKMVIDCLWPAQNPILLAGEEDEEEEEDTCKSSA